ncbi:membrane-associated protein, putative [Bodo saltans]|uniref:Membrane-associated protein, putative n=1 Tax=Bodo saltans TaxID=75058 RepID=A0A0S4J471_BODSA|nr:membrane-associated protein, putative [Bodo saltans]|eukprot:CUG86171.1 membrane-associated protein, putative [Bodo saltans]
MNFKSIPLMVKAFVAAVAVLVVVAASTAVAQQPEFVAGMLSTVPSGYALASLADLQSADFLNQYNSVGINYVQSFGSGFICCVVSVQEGYLSIGSSASYSSYITPFLNGVETCTSNTQPSGTTFGVPPFASGPYEGMWITNLTTKEQAGFLATGVTPTGAFSNCGLSGVATTAIFRVIPPKYIVQIVGTGAPVPSGFAVATLADLQSVDFQTSYNTAGGVVMAASPNNQNSYCCILSVSEGWVGYNDEVDSISPLGLYSEAFNAVECGYNQARQLVFIGTPFGGPNGGFVFRTFNASLVSSFGTFTRQNTSDCQSSPTTQTLLKSVV